MAEESITRDSLSAILKLVKSSEDTDVLKETCEWTVNQLMELDVEAQIGAKKHERCEERAGYRNGYRYPKTPLETRLGALNLVYEQPSLEEAHREVSKLVEWFEEKRWDTAVERLVEARDDILAHMHFPKDHWKRLRTTNPIERLNREVKRRTDTVGIFPDRNAVLRLSGMVLIEEHEKWISGKRYFSKESMQELLKQPAKASGKVVEMG